MAAHAGYGRLRPEDRLVPCKGALVGGGFLAVPAAALLRCLACITETL